MVACQRCRGVFDERMGACPYCGEPFGPYDTRVATPTSPPPGEGSAQPPRTLLFSQLPGAEDDLTTTGGKTLLFPSLPPPPAPDPTGVALGGVASPAAGLPPPWTPPAGGLSPNSSWPAPPPEGGATPPASSPPPTSPAAGGPPLGPSPRPRPSGETLAPPTKSKGFSAVFWVGLSLLLLAGAVALTVVLLQSNRSTVPAGEAAVSPTAGPTGQEASEFRPLPPIEPSTAPAAPIPGTVMAVPPLSPDIPAAQPSVEPAPPAGPVDKPPAASGKGKRDAGRKARGLPTGPPPEARGPIEPVRVSGNTLVGHLVHRVEPIFPPAARRARIEGMVLLTVRIGLRGEVHDVSVIRGHALLAPAAVTAVRKWRFEPFVINGRREVVQGTVVIRFSR